MSGQMSLGGFADAVPTDRLFFAVFPDTAAGEAIARLADDIGRQHDLRGAPLKRERLHITLHHLGDYAGLPAALVEDARRAAAQIVATPFEVTFDRVKSFAGRAEKKPCVLVGADGDTQLQRLRRQLGERLLKASLGKQVTREFTPHVTLRYERLLVPEQSVAPIVWTVREFALVHSLLGKTEHRILQRWTLLG
ncbi:RNA 2',3'-cyclic phosphodiesterase [Rudaea sp.]|uniref:RNA 2',3'-cyclic phosphodiesterase n=1 Tax=Rudaea sp. TaxID=2136325 RepID=UPI002ED28F3D